MKINKTGIITITDPPQHLFDAITKALTLKNPTYDQACRANPKAQFTLSPYFFYWKWDKENRILSIGRGVQERLEKYLNKHSLPFFIESSCVKPKMEFTSNIPVLREYQEGVPEIVVQKLLEQGDGVLRCDTGFGKTVVALRVAALLKTKTLVIVPKKDLKTQFEETRDEMFGMKESDCEIVTVQKIMHDMRYWQNRCNDFGLVIFDECHFAVPEKTRSVLELFNSTYRLGLTGTARRTDGQGEAIFFTFGPILFDKKMPRIEPKVRLIRYHGVLQGEQYADIIEEQVSDDARNQSIALIAVDQAKQGKKVLILTKRTAHYSLIAEQIEKNGAVLCTKLESTTNRKLRDETMKRLRDDPGSYQILLGTFSLLGTGTDIPSLDTLIIAGDLKSDVLAVQSVGRILRLFEGKADPLIIDIQDHGNPILRYQSQKREEMYEDLNWRME